MEIEKLFSSLMLEKEAQLSKGGLACYKCHVPFIKKWLIDDLQYTSLRQLTYDDVNRMLVNLKKNNMAESTIKNRMMVLKALIKIYAGVRTFDMKKILNISLKKAKNKKHYMPLTMEQLHLFIDYTKNIDTTTHNKRGLRRQLLFLLCLQNGLRAHEVINIEIDKINFDNKTIRLITTKTSVERDIIFDSFTEQVLNDYISSFNPKYYLFENPDTHKPIREDTVNDYFKLAKQDLGFQISCHMIRSTTASLMVQEDKNIYKIMVVMGHSDIRTTQIYIHNICPRITEEQRKCNPLSFIENQENGWIKCEKNKNTPVSPNVTTIEYSCLS